MAAWQQASGLLVNINMLVGDHGHSLCTLTYTITTTYCFIVVQEIPAMFVHKQLKLNFAVCCYSFYISPMVSFGQKNLGFGSDLAVLNCKRAL